MNDDFLYRIRIEPPAHFAQSLKERLDRTGRRGTKLAGFGIGLFLFGTAFALMLPATREILSTWFEAKPDERESAQLAATRAPARTEPALPLPSTAQSQASSSPAPPTEGVFPPDSVPANDDASWARARGGERPSPEQQTARSTEMLVDAERYVRTEAPAAGSPAAAAAPSNEDAPRPQSEFITTGPLLGELNTPAYAFDKRRALFTVMAWTMEPAAALLRRESVFDDARKIEVTGRRLEQLAWMIPDAFAYDTRRSNVQTRALNRVWEEPQLFAKRVEEMEVAARLLSRAAMSGNEASVRQAATRVTFVCKKCHEEFRKNGNNEVGDRYP